MMHPTARRGKQVIATDRNARHRAFSPEYQIVRWAMVRRPEAAGIGHRQDRRALGLADRPTTALPAAPRLNEQTARCNGPTPAADLKEDSAFVVARSFNVDTVLGCWSPRSGGTGAGS